MDMDIFNQIFNQLKLSICNQKHLPLSIFTR